MLDRFVTIMMPEVIVDFFEEIEVDDDEREGVTESLITIYLFRKLRFEMTTVVSFRGAGRGICNFKRLNILYYAHLSAHP